MPKHIVVEYEESYVPIDKPLEVEAPAAKCVTVLDVTQVGQENRYRYVVVWENGDV